MLIEAFTSISHGALTAALSTEQRDASAKLPKRLQFCKWGKNETVKGSFMVSGTAEAFAAEQKRLGKERIALDFEHNTLPGTNAYKDSKEPREVSAYGSPVLIPGEGVFLEDIVWTPTGIAKALNYEDISPAPYLDDDHQLVGMHSGALVRNGAVHDLHFFTADGEGLMANDKSTNDPSTTDYSTKTPEKSTMNEEEKAAFTALQEQVASLVEMMKAKDDDKAEAMSADATQVVALSTGMTALSTKVESMQRDALVESATRDGKVIPFSAEDMETLPVETLRGMIKKLPVTVPLSSETGTRKAVETGNVDTALAAVAKVTGFSVEQLKSGELTPKPEEVK